MTHSSSDSSTKSPQTTTTDTGKLLDHNYDGIQEMDNPLPFWWVALFFLTIVFGLVYFVYYTFGPGLTSYEKLERDMAASQPQETVVSVVKFDSSPDAISAGATLFAAKCAACHRADAGGLIGPNLTDSYWIHGNGSNETIYDVIKNGVVEKGMLAWGTQLSPEDMANLTVYIQSIKGSNPENAKAPQGTQY